MQAVVPAAGEGTRLRPLTADTPKGLVEVAGQPLLTHVFETLVSLDVDHIVVVIGYKGAQIPEHFGDGYRGIPLTYVDQQDRRGLAHAISRAADHIDAPFVVMNGDNVFGSPPNEELRTFEQTACDGVLVVERASPAVVKTGGEVRTTEGRVTEVIEKPESPDTHLVTTGCYLLPPAFFEGAQTIAPSSRGELELTDAINALIGQGMAFRATEFRGWRYNVNTQKDIEAVEDRIDDQ